ncbi:adenylate/guanylate cyclase domain-containing protein [Aeromicrobium stalagmiti]|uniref:adenylate/guanylate cyclase domain-containing protein n=1 Tax=Aeromicrobium stalagmiti TaxID=2738988 RepID=UPI001567ED13|nr:adenylate/guanylate cyclase domain-containing protein [Aeromicrobium stalagmiti]
MSALEVVLAASTAALATALVVVVVRLGRARRELAHVQAQLDRPRLVPSPTDAVRTVLGTAMKVRDHGFGGAFRSSIDDLLQWADVERPDLARLASTDGTVTIMFSDIQDSTALNHRLGDRGWVRLLARHDRMLQRAIDAHAGHVVKTQGDGFMVAFAEASQAVGAAFDIQRELARVRPGSRLHGVAVRIGAHKGSAVRRDNDLFGRNVAFAARVAAQADGGEVLVSEALVGTLGDAVTVLETREAVLKGVPGTHRMHVLDWRP